MRRFIALLLIAVAPLIAGAHAGGCADADACPAETPARADAELNQVYRRLLSRLNARGDARAALIADQLAWLQARDAQCGSFGRSAAEGVGQCRASLTAARVKVLSLRLDCQDADASCPSPP